MPRIDSVLVVGNIHSDISADAFLKKFLRVTLEYYRDVTLVSGDLPAEFRDAVDWHDTSGYATGRKSFLARLWNYNLYQLRMLRLIVAIFRDRDPGTVVFLAPVPALLVYARMRRRKIIRYQGGSFAKQQGTGRPSPAGALAVLLFEKLPYLLSDTVIVEAESSVAFQGLERFRDKVAVAPLFVDAGMFACTRDIGRRKRTVGFVGGLNENKGFDVFIRSIARLAEFIRDNDIEVLILGDGPLKKDIGEIGSDDRLKGRFRHIARVPHEKLADYLNQMTLIVIPSRSEGLPNVLLEAMSCGTVALATAVGGMPDLVREGVTGYIVEDNTPEYLEKRIIYILNNSNIAVCSLNAMHLVRERYSYSSCSERYRQVFAR